jgi:bifunctional DNA-binding transcriptional regulator/antitoxin component of YhaV-PrlF toxin-antitoxin module
MELDSVEGARIKTKVGQVGSSLRIVVPQQVARELGWEKGTNIKMTVKGSRVILEKV